MWYGVAVDILADPEKYKESAIEEAEEKIGEAIAKYISFRVALEKYIFVATYILKRVLYYLGSFIALCGTLIMLGNITADAPLTFRQIVPIELVTLAGAICAYLCNELIKLERRGRHGKRKSRA